MSTMSVFPQPVSRPEQVQLKEEMRALTTQNKLLQQKIISLEKELYAIRNTDLFKKIRRLERRLDDTLREFKQANEEHLQYSKEFEDWMRDTRSKNEELMKENSRLREELKNTRVQ